MVGIYIKIPILYIIFEWSIIEVVSLKVNHAGALTVVTSDSLGAWFSPGSVALGTSVSNVYVDVLVDTSR